MFRNSTTHSKASVKWLVLLIMLALQVPSLLQAQVNADFSLSTTQGCTPLLIQFNDLSTSTASGIASWQWDFGDNTNTTIQNPAKVFTSAGNFTVCLIVTDSLGNTDTTCMANLISVTSSPTAEFSGIPTTGCAPVTVQFSDSSTQGSNPITSWQWTFGTGAASNQQNPSFTYNNVGNNTVSLTVTDQNGCSDQVVKSNYVVVKGIPDANFTSATTQYCSFPASVNFANTTVAPTGANMVYKWYFGDGDSASVANPSHTYASPGNYDVTLIARDTSSPTNCADTLTVIDFVQVFNNNSLNYTYSPATGCDAINVQFSNTTACPSSNWQWDFGDGSPTSSDENPSHTYSSPGTYTVIFSAIVDGVPLSDTCTNCITVNQSPSVSYTTTGTIATCFMPISASFAGTSNDPTATYLWDFGNDSTSTQQNPSYVYTEGGTFPVTLTATSTNGCSNSVTTDTVFARPIVANYIENRVSSCVGDPIEFLDSTVSFYPITSWVWDFTDTSSTDQNPTITFSDTGSYNVSLIVTNSLGCVDTLTNTAEVGDTLVLAFEADDTTACFDEDVVFTNNTDPALVALVTDWSWDFGDGGSSSQFEPTYAYSDTGTFTVVLTASYNNCESRKEIENYIEVGPPESDFEADRDCAAPLQVSFIDKSVGADIYSWDFGVAGMTNDTSNLAEPTFNYPSSGTYIVKLTVYNTQTGCSHEKSQALILNAAEDVQINLSDTAGCSPLVISVSNTSSLASYAWTSNGGVINDTTLAQPTITYATPGVYDSIKLIVTHPTGCVEEILLPDSIRVSTVSPLIQASTSSGCAPLSVNFTDLTFSTAGIATYIWDFGTGDSAFVQNPTYTYTASGAFQPTLTVVDNIGCTQQATLSSSIVPTAPYVEYLSDTFACTGQLISFANLSTGIGLSHAWDFGDGNTSNQISPDHTYMIEGTFNACLTVTDINGCSSTFCRTIVIANPVANFGANNTQSNCQALSVQFFDNSQNAVSWFWDFGDSTTSTLQNPVKVYSEPGTYDVCLVVTGQSGCVDTLCQAGLIQVNGPSADFSFTPNSGCPGTVVTFTATGEDVDDFIFVWGDFTSTTIPGTGGNDTITVTHTYVDGGIYKPAIVAEDPQGCQLTYLSQDSIVIEDFSIDIIKSEDTLCGAGNVQLTANISSLSAVTSLNWTYGTPAQTSSNNPVTVNVNALGVYPISITASNASCTRTVVDSIEVFNLPTALMGIAPSQACVPQTVIFTDSSTVMNDSIVHYVWDFGNGTTDSTANTSFLYNMPGTYNVELRIETDKGCKDTTQATVDIFANPTANAGTDQTICIGQTASLQATGGMSYVWDSSATLSCLNCPDPIASPTQTTDYIVTVTSADGCTDVDTVTVNVSGNPVAVITNLPVTVCDGAAIQMTDSSYALNGTITNWDWDFGNSTTSTMQNPVANYTQAGSYTVTLIATASSGCTDTTTGLVVINTSPNAAANFDAFICQGQSATLTASGGVSYQWTPNNGLDCDTCSVVNASPMVTTVYNVQVTAANGCTASDTVRVDVAPYPAPPLFVSNDTTICYGDTIQLLATGGTSVLDYQWDPNSPGLTCYTNCNNPFAAPLQTTTYYVTLTGVGGCTALDSITVTVISPNSDIIELDSATICDGDSVQLNTTIGLSHVWSPFDGLSCGICDAPYAFPATTTVYNVTAISSNGCFITDSVVVNVIDRNSVNAGDDVGLCLGNSIQLNGTGDGQVTWSPAATLDNPNILNPTASPTQTTDYILSINNGFCVLTDTMSVVIIEEPLLEVQDVAICAGDSITLPVVALADSFVWSPSAGLSATNIQSPIAAPSATTTYTVTASLAGCTTVSKEVQVTVNPLPMVDGFPVQEVFTGVTSDIKLDVEINPNFTYNWYTLDSSLLSCATCIDPRIVAPVNDTRVYVDITTLEGCVTNAFIDIRLVNDCQEDLMILPNAFTPNGDGLNDVLYVRGSGLNEIITFRVFSRSGQNVFTSSDLSVGWDGTYNGRELNTDIYVYFAEAVCPITGNIVRKTGNVMLIRN